MPARGLAGSSLFSLFVAAFVLASCSVYLDDLSAGRMDGGSPAAGAGGQAGLAAAGAGALDASGTTGGAGRAGTGGIGGSAGAGGADRDAMGAGGNGAGAGTGGFSGTGGASGAAGGSGPDASAGAAGIAGSGGLGGTAGMDGSGGFGGAAGSGGQSGSAGSAGTSGAGGTEAGADTIIVLDTGVSDVPRDDRTAGDVTDSGGPCRGSVCKRVFVSSQPPPAGANLGGLTAADDFCQSAAETNQLGGTWKAWLSDPTTSAAARLTHATVPYVLLDGNTVAANWSALTSGTLAHAINVSEDGTVHTSNVLEVWTGTTLAGAYSGRSCSAWTSNAPGSTTADVGLSNQINGNWTNRYQQYCDRTNVHLYCFEQ
jgi:hypothetical protein